MGKISIVCDISFKFHWLQESYFNSIKNLFDGNINIVQSENDLNDTEILFICDEHFQPNKEIWMKDSFINKCNNLNIKVVIFNNEKIHNSYFKWNEDIQRNVNKFKNKVQFVYDVNDAKILNADINKTYMSKYYSNLQINKDIVKKDKIVFVGNYKNNTYSRRQLLLREIVNKFDVDIIDSNPNRTTTEYLNLINEYKYVLSPIGNGDFVPMRFYEALFVGSIPIQQYVGDMVDYFDYEKNFGIFFKDVNDLKLTDVENFNGFYMEDFMSNMLKKYKII